MSELLKKIAHFFQRPKPEETDYARLPSFADLLEMSACPTLQNFAKLTQDIAPVVNNLIFYQKILPSDSATNNVRLVSVGTKDDQFSDYKSTVIELECQEEDKLTHMSIIINPYLYFLSDRGSVRGTSIKLSIRGQDREPLVMHVVRAVEDIDNKDSVRWILFNGELPLNEDEINFLQTGRLSTRPEDLIPIIFEPITSLFSEVYTDHKLAYNIDKQAKESYNYFMTVGENENNIIEFPDKLAIAIQAAVNRFNQARLDGVNDRKLTYLALNVLKLQVSDPNLTIKRRETLEDRKQFLENILADIISPSTE